MPAIDEHGRFIEKVAQLVTILNEAVLLANDVLREIQREPAGDLSESLQSAAVLTLNWVRGNGSFQPPLVDQTTFSVNWCDKRCYLGNTLPFRLFERLARRPNQFFSYNQLFQEVWDGERSNDAVRSVVKVLKKKLAEAGMDELAAAINGTNPGYYGLLLNRQS